MRKNELVYYYALDRKWMSTEQAHALLQRAEKEGLIHQENGVYAPRFDTADIVIPIGFKPGSALFDQHDPSQELIARIAHARNIPETDVVAGMNRLIREGFDGNLLPPAALVLIAKEEQVPFEDLLDALRASFTKR